MPKLSLPKFVEPMRPTLVKQPFNSPDFIFGTKLDGYRAIASDGEDFTSVLKRRERLVHIISPVEGIQVGSWIGKRGKNL